MSGRFTRTHHHVISLIQLCKESLDVFGLVLTVSVQKHKDITVRMPRAGLDGRTITDIRYMPDYCYACDFGDRYCRPIIDYNYFCLWIEGFKLRQQGS